MPQWPVSAAPETPILICKCTFFGSMWEIVLQVYLRFDRRFRRGRCDGEIVADALGEEARGGRFPHRDEHVLKGRQLIHELKQLFAVHVGRVAVDGFDAAAHRYLLPMYLDR